MTLCIHHPPRQCHGCGAPREFTVRSWHESRRWRSYDMECRHCGEPYRVVYRRKDGRLAHAR